MLEVEGAHEVWARVVWAAVDAAEQGGLPIAALFEGLPFDAARLRRRKHVRWEDYCAIVETIAALAGSRDALHDLLEASYHQVNPELRTLAGKLVSPQTFVRYLIDVVNPIWFPPIQFGYEALDEQRMRVTLRLRPGVRSCAAFFDASIGTARGVSRHLDLPRTEVLSADIGPRHGVYELRLPESQSIAARVGRASRVALERITARFVLGSRDEGGLFDLGLGSAAPSDPFADRMERARVDWALTNRQIEVLPLLVKGQSNKQIAKALGCAENTVEHHITQILRKADAETRTQLMALFWSKT